MAFVVIATWTAKPGKEGSVVEVIRAMTGPSRAEPRNLFYQAQVSPDAPETFVLYEQYADAAGYEEHKRSDHFQAHVVNHGLELLDKREVRTYSTIDD